MGTQALTKPIEKRPLFFDDFFKPWNEWFDNDKFFNRTINVPAVNITEEKNEYMVALAVPGMKKDDFYINIEGNMMTITCEKEETKEEKEKKFTRKEYNFSSFSRTFTLPEEIDQQKIDASYVDGILKIRLPFNLELKKPLAKNIAVK
jgi:HSP20 family protein